jgi:hypothetical protein
MVSALASDAFFHAYLLKNSLHWWPTISLNDGAQVRAMAAIVIL